MANVSFRCSECNKEFPIETMDFRCTCGEPFNLFFTPERFSLDLIDKNEWSLFRYKAFLPVTNDLWKDISLGEGKTPLVKLQNNVFLKADYYMPTLSFKERGAALVIWLAKTLGVKKILQDSSGNAGNSIAAYAARAGIDCEIYVPQGTSDGKIKMITSHGAKVNVLPLSRDETAEACRQAVLDGQGYYASHVFNPFFYQGTKTFVYEVFEQLGRLPDNFFIPVGNGTLLLGVFLAFDELLSSGIIKKLPKIFAVQSERCAPILEVYNTQGAETQGKPAVPNRPPVKTMAEGIAIGQPARLKQILRKCKQMDVEFIPAPENTILKAREILAKSGFFVEHTTAATYAAYLLHQEKHNIKGDVLLPLCGAGLKSEH